MPEEKEKGLKHATVILMIGTAVFFDVLQWLMAFILMDWAVGFFAYLTFFVWFRMHGISFMKPKRLLVMGGSALIEMIPVVSALPAWTAAVTYLAMESKIKSAIPGADITKLDIMKK